ncbi:MAG TPA: hypothetical protein PLT00_11815 [Verrucomicrobiota bacterium]|nr:hypothetical protein [Verrucomicrobiota bacterium]HQB17387.1 hypothetical protein [Verrucomicrobiota bacterium]
MPETNRETGKSVVVTMANEQVKIVAGQGGWWRIRLVAGGEKP